MRSARTSPPARGTSPSSSRSTAPSSSRDATPPRRSPRWWSWGRYFLIAVLGAIAFFPASTLPWGLLGVSFGLALLYTLSALAVAFTLSAFIRTPAIGVLVTVLVLYVGFATVQSVAELGGLEPWWSFTYAGAIAAVLDIDFAHFQSIPVGQNETLTAWTASPSEGAVVMLVYLFVFLGLSIYLYETKESTG